MKIVNVCSVLRQNDDHSQAFFAQLEALSQRQFVVGCYTIVCDGNGTVRDPHLAAFASRHSNVRILAEEASDAALFRLEDKAQQWSQIINQALVASLERPSTHTLFVESDLCLPYDLVDQLLARDRDIIAPIVFLGGSFYDHWGFRRLDGSRIADFGQLGVMDEPVELSSVGSCALIKTEILQRGARFTPTFENGLFVGMCTQARAMGYRIWADPANSIVHPSSRWRSQVWLVTRIIVSRAGAAPRTFEGRYVLSGIYDEFLRDVIGQVYSAHADQFPAGTYGLRVVRNSRDRTVTLWFEGDATAAPTGEFEILSQLSILDEADESSVRVVTF